jgi:hypothetical protein
VAVSYKSRIESKQLDYDESDDRRRQFQQDMADGMSDLAGFAVECTTPASANTEFSIQHTLGRKPEEFHLIWSGLGGRIYVSSIEKWTNTVARFKYTGTADTIRVRLR